MHFARSRCRSQRFECRLQWHHDHFTLIKIAWGWTQMGTVPTACVCPPNVIECRCFSIGELFPWTENEAEVMETSSITANFSKAANALAARRRSSRTRRRSFCICRPAPSRRRGSARAVQTERHRVILVASSQRHAARRIAHKLER